MPPLGDDDATSLVHADEDEEDGGIEGECGASDRQRDVARTAEAHAGKPWRGDKDPGDEHPSMSCSPPPSEHSLDAQLTTACQHHKSGDKEIRHHTEREDGRDGE